MIRRGSPARPLLGAFLAITILLVAALGWLGWRLLEQDRELERQRARERLESAADAAAAAIQRRLRDLQDSLGQTTAAGDGASPLDPAPLSVLVRATDDSFAITGRERLLFGPSGPSAMGLPLSVFATADSLEFRAGNAAAAMRASLALASAHEGPVRAAALLRVARTSRKAERSALADSAYQDLIALATTAVNGVPAELLGRAGRLAVRREREDEAGARREAAAIHAALHAGRWNLSRASFEFYDAEVSTLLGEPPLPHGDSVTAARVALSSAVDSLWHAWQEGRLPRASTVRSLSAGDRELLSIWAAHAEGVVGLVADATFAVHHIVEPVARSLPTPVALSLGPPSPAVAARTPARPSAVRGADETGLPWPLRVQALDSGAGELAERRRLLLAGLAVASLLALFGTYAVARAASRELRVAQLQADFVAAVSHELRTPLTSLRQLTELLTSGRVASAERRVEYYEAMRRETARLSRFVESLLEFRRAEAGFVEPLSTTLDLTRLVRDTVDEFARDARRGGFSVTVDLPDEPAIIRGDTEAIQRALWNILDNAVKYSPDDRAVEVTVLRGTKEVMAVIRDRGLGIDADDLPKIFAQFERGAAARSRGIRGTGIGLAIVKQVAEAHGGSVTIDSAPGRGTVVSLAFPLAEDGG